MNKSKFLMVLFGIFLITTRLWVSFGGIVIDITHDTAGFLLILVGMLPIRKRNSVFKRSFLVAIIGFLSSILSQVMLFIQWDSSVDTMRSVAIGISIVFVIYFTYYFTQALIMESNIQEKQAVSRNYQLTWFVLAAFIFAHFFIFMSAINTYSILSQALIIIISLYYCSTILSTAMQLFEE